MSRIASVAQALQTVLTTDANQAARLSGCVQRQGKFTGATLCQTLVFGWLANPQATLSQLCQMAAACRVTVSPQGLDQRFTPELAACLELVLDSAIRQVVQTSSRATSLLAHFPQVVVRDSTTMTLPAVLRSIRQGCGDATAEGHQAVLRVSVGLHMRAGTLEGPLLADGREHDQTVAAEHPPLLPGTLLLQDLGYSPSPVARCRVVVPPSGRSSPVPPPGVDSIPATTGPMPTNAGSIPLSGATLDAYALPPLCLSRLVTRDVNAGRHETLGTSLGHVLGT